MSGPLTNDMWKIGDWIEKKAAIPFIVIAYILWYGIWFTVPAAAIKYLFFD